MRALPPPACNDAAMIRGPQKKTERENPAPHTQHHRLPDIFTGTPCACIHPWMLAFLRRRGETAIQAVGHP